jgi:hypothetical protein
MHQKRDRDFVESQWHGFDAEQPQDIPRNPQEVPMYVHPKPGKEGIPANGWTSTFGAMGSY